MAHAHAEPKFFSREPAPGLPPPPDGYSVFTEASTSVLYQSAKDVFYNPAMVTNRDLSVLVISHYLDVLRRERARKKSSRMPAEDRPRPDDPAGISILEALSATGLRSIRFAKELPEGVGRIIVNDMDAAAVRCIEKNIEYNQPPPLPRLEPSLGDAISVMYSHRSQRLDVIDIDPYGSPSMFLDGAVQAVKDGGLLCITATDLAVLCGNNAEVCYAKYQAVCQRGAHCHEQAIRIVLGAVERTANRYRRHIVPVLSLSIDYYLRVFVRVYTSPRQIKESCVKQAMVFQCNSCWTRYLQPLCKAARKGDNAKFTPVTHNVPGTCGTCGFRMNMGGPIWIDPINDPEWIDGVLKLSGTHAHPLHSGARLQGLLKAAAGELHDVPLFYDLSQLLKVIHASPPQMNQVYSAIVNAGYEVSGSHANPNAIKTTAPVDVIWDILREWSKKNGIKKPKEGTAAAVILAKESTTEVDFTVAKEHAARKRGRFLPPPTDHWGPKARAVGDKRRRGEEQDEEGSASSTSSSADDAATKRHKTE